MYLYGAPPFRFRDTKCRVYHCMVKSLMSSVGPSQSFVAATLIIRSSFITCCVLGEDLRGCLLVGSLPTLKVLFLALSGWLLDGWVFVSHWTIFYEWSCTISTPYNSTYGSATKTLWESRRDHVTCWMRYSAIVPYRCLFAIPPDMCIWQHVSPAHFGDQR